MATLRDLCTEVPKTINRMAVERELLRRKAASYLKRLEVLSAQDHVFDSCKQTRPQKGKYKNRASKEAAGTQGAITMGIRTGAYSVCVCKTQNKW